MSQTSQTVYDFKASKSNYTTHAEELFHLSQYKGKVILIVNTASHCGLVDQLKELQTIHETYNGDVVVLGFPCSQFLGQEFDDPKETQNFACTKYNVTFPLFDKINVNGPNTHPLFEFLKTKKPGIWGTTSIKWNFTKFLIGKDGIPVKRFGPRDSFEEIRKEIDVELSK